MALRIVCTTVACSLGLLAVSTSEAGTTTFTPTADAQILSDVPTTNYATGTRMAADGAPYAQQALIKFSITNLSGTVTSAKRTTRSRSMGLAGDGMRRR